MSNRNLERLVEAGIVPEDFRNAAEFLKAIDSLSEDEVNELLRIKEKCESFQVTAKGTIKPLWC